MASCQTMLTLNTGAKMPAFGFGTWQAPPEEVETAVDVALRAGYRLLDAAAIYRNEPAVGSGIKKSGINRDDIFLISKLWNSKHRPEDVEPALDKTLADLGTTHLDLYLMHWPDAFKSGDNYFPIDEQGDFLHDDIDPAITWKAMEKLLATRKVRAIGICNFTASRLEALLQQCSVVPAVNQVELHPFFQQQDLIDYCKSKGICVQAYSPLGNNQFGHPRAIDDSRVLNLARELDMTPAQLVYAWGVQRGYCVISKSITAERIKSNLHLKQVPESAMAVLESMERNSRYNFPVHWGIDIFQEWRPDKLEAEAKSCRESNLSKFAV